MHHVIYPTVIDGVIYGGSWGSIHLSLSAGERHLRIKRWSKSDLKTGGLLWTIRYRLLCDKQDWIIKGTR